MVVRKTLVGHKKAINALTPSQDGTVLLSGGDDAILRIWNLESGELMQEMSCYFHGPIGAITWVDLGEGLDKAFVFGCGDGTLHVYARDDKTGTFQFQFLISGHGDHVEDVKFDARHGRITPELQPFMARAVRFCDDGSSIVIFYVESHEVRCFSIEPKGLKWSKKLPTHLSSDEKMLWVTNPITGLDQYRFPSMERMRNFPYTIVRNYPMQVALHGAYAVIGGDDGSVHMFDTTNYHSVEKLAHGKAGSLVQTVTAFSNEAGLSVVTASSGEQDLAASVEKSQS
ncbi:WD40-repeat-containing domain protein [Amylocystis lapponica]|nr:WD40-repeat-containing domain protein [Amylocystis lapponica]